MAVPTSISDCNATAANNSPAGSDSIGTSLDDYLRAHAAILRQVSDDVIHLAGGTVTGQIKGITPVAAADLARKDYVDTMLPKAGGTVTGQIKGITPVADEDLARKDYVDSAVSVVNTSSGTYTPTINNSVNLNALGSTAGFSYTRVGNIVNVTGNFSHQATTNGTLTSVRISLPVASNFSSSSQANGVIVSCDSVPTSDRSSGTIYADTTNDACVARWYPTLNGVAGIAVVSFSYQVI